MQRRSFLKCAAGVGLFTAAGELGFLARLPSVSAAEAKLDSKVIQLHPEIEPLVRLLEETPRERVIEEIGARIRKGLSYREVLAALFLAGVRNIQPRPVGFKFHAVLVVNSAHLASLASSDSDRWLPILWAIDQFKSSQAADIREGDWTLGPVDESAVPPSHKARQAFIEAMDHWDEAAADAAIVGLARTAGAHEIFELLSRYGARDFREIGHKEIYVANSFRTLQAIGWHHAEPVLRSLAFALLDRDGARDNPAKADFPADRPYRHNLEAMRNIKSGWLDGKRSPEATAEMLQTLRQANPQDAATKTIGLLNRGASPESLFDAFFEASGELMIRSPGILSLHATTFTNALHYAWRHCREEDTRKLLLLQNASFLPLFRGNTKGGQAIDQLEPAEETPAEVGDVLAELGTDRLSASRKMLAYLKANPDPKPLADAARRLIFTRGTNSHDYKYSSAVLEDYHAIAQPWRDHFLASMAFYLKTPKDPENQLVQRTRSALALILLGFFVLLGPVQAADVPRSGTNFIATQSFSLEDDKKILKAFEGLRVADVTDGMDAVGLQNIGLMNPEIHALWKDTKEFKHRFVGIAVTARYVPSQKPPAGKMNTEDYDQWVGNWYSKYSPEPWVPLLREGSALIIEEAPHADVGSIGSNNIMSWKVRGCVGVVTSATARDTDEIITQQIPLYFKKPGRGIRPGRNEIESVNRPITCGGVLVMPGDVIVADGDGVIVVPRQHAEEVARYAHKILEGDKAGRRNLYQRLGIPEDSTVK